MTKGEFVSGIINTLKYLTKDDHISRRYVLSIGMMNAKFLLAQKLGDRSLYKNNSLFRTITCFPLEEKGAIECLGVDIPSCGSIMVSKEKINGLIYSKYGSSIVRVSTVDGGTIFDETSSKAFQTMMKRPFASKVVKNKNYYYEQDGKIYIPNSTIEAVDVVYIPWDDSKVEEQSGCKTCKEEENIGCKSIWDTEFVCSDELISIVQRETLAQVSNGRGIPTDENPNMDSNIKSQTVK